MWKKLRLASSVLILPTALLYLLGFICITGYYAQFGFVTFDIINARFMIAGIHAAIALGFCGIAAWHIAKSTLIDRLIGFEAIFNRHAIYAKLLLYPLPIAWSLSVIYGLSTFTKGNNPDTVKLSPIAWWDVVGYSLRAIGVDTPSMWSFLVGTLAYTFAILFIVALAILIAGDLVSLRARYRAAASTSTQGEVQATVVAGTVVSPAQKAAVPIGDFASEIIRAKRWRKYFAVTMEIFFAAMVITAFLYTSGKSNSELFDANAFGHTGVSTLLIYCWAFSTIFGVVLFVNFRDVFPTIASGELTKLLDPLLAPQLLQMVAFPILLSALLFGATIFPRIPFGIGGGEPRSVKMYFKESGGHEIERREMFLLGESTQYLFAVELRKQGSSAFEISKDFVRAIESRAISNKK